MTRLFYDDDFQFGLEIVLGATYRQAADAGEALATAQRIEDGDADAWIREWSATADAARDAGEEARAAGRHVSALGYHRRAATYYATALYCAAKAPAFGAQDELAVWQRQRECWEHVVDLSGGERIAIAYEHTTLPGWFFRAPDATGGERRPLVILNNGSDGATSSMWAHGGAAAAERGYHWMTFDGPGQQTALFEQGIPFRHDWEAALTPVVDAMLARDDVDAARIAVIGVSQAGYWIPRALAFEHRLAAAVADGGVVDVSRSWLHPLPPQLRALLAAGDREAFDEAMRMGEQAAPALKATLEFRGRPYGVENGSRYELFQAVSRYRLGDEVRDITTPLLVLDPDDEQFFPGQPQELFERLTGDRALMRFTVEQGANRHCEPLAVGLRDTRVFDWLEGYLR
jgi:hypothetical protein